MKKAIVFGATGFIGSHLLRALLGNPDYERVIAVVRKPLALSHAKLTTLIGDLALLPALKPQLVADEVFIALGTTRKHTPDEAEYYKIDHDYPVLAAEIAKANGARSVFLVTAVGANAGSSLFYVRTKGEVERDVLALDFDHTHIFRPSMIMGQRDEERPGERMIIAVWNVINPLLVGPVDRYRGLDGEEIARAIAKAAQHQTEKVRIYHWNEMAALLRA
ncbi:oxidoreductase [Afipia sp. GAS231]|uniref:oxidoreductase n=1 Tax=Afipia sp. GAS231 TaxID=1882747 RepID=UPI00087B4E55|nr:oxidoreductase [Afipia sp. GAS231]SDP45203.1 Uncharacterized conserved protein YbjT, contains NAD(P)-binding and DUF2867 domains [Afipia sp. GAS231]